MEDDPRLASLTSLLAQSRRPLWAKGTVPVAHIELNPALERTLLSLSGLNQLERGLENITSLLANEKRGIDVMNARQGQAPAFRVSRLLLIADDASERFNRGCERLLLEHDDRILGIRMNITDAQLIEKLYGADALAKVLLISHKDAVTRALWSIVE